MLSRCIYLSHCSLDCYLFYTWYIGTPAPVQLSREPKTANCQVAHLECIVRKSSSWRKENQKIRQFEWWRTARQSWILYVPRVRVIDTGRSELYSRTLPSGWGFGTGCSRSSTTAGGCYVWWPVSTTVGRVGQVVSALCHHRRLSTTVALCVVGSMSTGRYDVGSLDQRCHHQWIAVESKHRCFIGKLKFCKIVQEL